MKLDISSQDFARFYFDTSWLNEEFEWHWRWKEEKSKTGVETPVSTNLGEKTSLVPSHFF
jgi:hypothetical protein